MLHPFHIGTRIAQFLVGSIRVVPWELVPQPAKDRDHGHLQAEAQEEARGAAEGEEAPSVRALLRSNEEWGLGKMFETTRNSPGQTDGREN